MLWHKYFVCLSAKSCRRVCRWRLGALFLIRDSLSMMISRPSCKRHLFDQVAFFATVPCDPRAFFGAFFVLPLYWFDSPSWRILLKKSSKEKETVALILITSCFINQGLVSAKGLSYFLNGSITRKYPLKTNKNQNILRTTGNQKVICKLSVASVGFSFGFVLDWFTG